MLTVFQALHTGGDAGTPLPLSYRTLREGGAEFRCSQTSMLAGIPGACKSMFALNLLYRWQVPALYFAIDSDPMSLVKRVSAVGTEKPISQFEGVNPDTIPPEVLDRTRFLRARFSQPTFEEIDLEVMAFNEINGRPPKVIVIDNLINLVGGVMDFQAMIEALSQLDELAGDIQAHILVLHHTSESIRKANDLPAMSDIQGKINQFPRMILTLAKIPDLNELRCAVVKNSHGRADASGNLWTSFFLNEPTMSILERNAGGNFEEWNQGSPQG